MKAREVNQPKVISRELLKPNDERSETSKQYIEEFLSSIKKQKGEKSRLEQIQKGPRIESIVSESGERMLIKKNAEPSKIDLRGKINIAEDSSKSILNRITKKH